MAYSQIGAPTLLSLPELVLDHIAQLLPQAGRLNLAATCKALHSCCPRWFAEIEVRLPLNAPHKVAHLAAWLRRHPVRACVLLAAGPEFQWGNEALVAALTTARLMQLALAPEVAPHIAALCSTPDQHLPTLAELLPAFPALECLDLSHLGRMLGSVEPLWGLTRLTRLSFDGQSASGSWSGLSQLTQLLHLGYIVRCDQRAVAAALPSLSALTCLQLAHSRPGTAAANWSSFSRLQGLRELSLMSRQAAHSLRHLPVSSLRQIDLYTDDMPALPAHLSRFTALEHLLLGHNPPPGADDQQSIPLPAASFSNLTALTRLQHLGFESYHIAPAEVPLALTALSSLTYLSVSFVGTATGWDRLQSLPLQHLAVDGDRLPRLPTLPILASFMFFGKANMTPPTEAELSECLAPNTHLHELVLDRCNLPAVPSIVSLLTRLTHLDLSGNAIAAGLEHLNALTTLQFLDLGDNDNM